MSLDPAATMRRFGERNHPPGFHTPAVFQPEYLDARRLHGFFVVEIDGCKVLLGKEALDAEIGKLERLKEEAARKIKQLKHAIGEME